MGKISPNRRGPYVLQMFLNMLLKHAGEKRQKGSDTYMHTLFMVDLGWLASHQETSDVTSEQLKDVFSFILFKQP